MDDILVVLFDGERQAYKGYWALKRLEAEGRIALFDEVLLSSQPDGKVIVKESSEQDPGLTVERMVNESEIGLLGPMGAVVEAEIVDRVARHLEPGKSAIVAEVQEELWKLTDSRLEAVGGKVYRRAAVAAADDQVSRDFSEIGADIVRLRSGHGRLRRAVKAKLRERDDSPDRRGEHGSNADLTEVNTEGARDQSSTERTDRRWWTLASRGLAAIVFGFAAFAWPAITLSVLVLLFGAYTLAQGFISMADASGQKAGPRWPFVLEGIFGIGVGAWTLVWPAIAGTFLLYVVAGWAISIGLIEIVEAVWVHGTVRNDWLLMVSGITSTVFGALLLFAPGAGTLAVAHAVGAYALVFGAIDLAFGLRLRSVSQRWAA